MRSVLKNLFQIVSLFLQLFELSLFLLMTSCSLRIDQHASKTLAICETEKHYIEAGIKNKEGASRLAAFSRIPEFLNSQMDCLSENNKSLDWIEGCVSFVLRNKKLSLYEAVHASYEFSTAFKLLQRHTSDAMETKALKGMKRILNVLQIYCSNHSDRLMALWGGRDSLEDQTIRSMLFDFDLFTMDAG